MNRVGMTMPTLLIGSDYSYSNWSFVINHEGNMQDLGVWVVMPAFKSKSLIKPVIEAVHEIVTKIIVIDDGCPEGTGNYVKKNIKDKRVEVIFNKKNLGVGGAVIEGYKKALEDGAKIIVKLDSDGQMDPALIPYLISPIISGDADYTKGNRFDSLDDLQQMPKLRIFGNAILSLMSKISSGYWNITDPTNGYTAIHESALRKIHLGKLRRGWFFESDMLFRLSIIRAVVQDVPMQARYGNEKSNLKIRKVLWEFPFRHSVNHHKRLFYTYYLREWSIGSIELPTGMILFFGGIIAGINFWASSAISGNATTVGQVMLAALPMILGFQLLLAFIGFDIAAEPRRPIQKLSQVKLDN